MYKYYYNNYDEPEVEMQSSEYYIPAFRTFTSLSKRSQKKVTEWWWQKKVGEGDGHKSCPFCGGIPALYERCKYIGQRNHKWGCDRYYYRYAVCQECHCQTKMFLSQYEYDDADTVYPLHPERWVSDDAIWAYWDNRT